jgi:predicted DNA-binding transcriptional regulator YafY
MNRTDRLYALVEELRARAPRVMRATDLAARFEVTVRTIQRDLLALQEAGVPIWAQPGPGGGYGLNVETTLPPLNFTPTEAAAIAIALATTRAMPFPEAGHAALNKLVGAMATVPKDTAARIVSRVRVISRPEAPIDLASNVILQALLDSVAVDLTYRDARGDLTRRIVEPVGVLGTNNGWYLAGWCRLRQSARTFRLDRIVKIFILDERVPDRSLDAILGELPFDLTEPALM